MQDIKIRFTSGPLRGHSAEVEVGDVMIGRQPGNGGVELKGAETSVSRQHAQLVEDGGDEQVQRGEQSSGPSRVEAREVDSAASLVLVEQESGDEEARQDEEDRHADVALPPEEFNRLAGSVKGMIARAASRAANPVIATSARRRRLQH